MKIKKMDIALGLIFILIGISSFFLINRLNAVDSTSAQVLITSEGKLQGSYDLDKDDEIEVINGEKKNKITIKNRMVNMSSATCDNQDCIRQGKIHDGSKSIICLPNKVIVEIKTKEKEFDSITR